MQRSLSICVIIRRQKLSRDERRSLDFSNSRRRINGLVVCVTVNVVVICMLVKGLWRTAEEEVGRGLRTLKLIEL